MVKGYTFSSLARILAVKPLQLHSDPVIEFILTDSRQLLTPGTTVFFAINSKQKNAIDFILPLYEQGVRCFIVPALLPADTLEVCVEANIVEVENVLFALQKIVAQHRASLNIPVIGITGSNGKTIVKEWLHQLLKKDFHIAYSPKSYNSQLGVPLSVWQMDDTHSLGIFEAGISLPGEMQRLQKIIQPTIGLFTFLGDAHALGFKSLSQKVHEKLQLFVEARTLIYCSDNTFLAAAIVDFKKNQNPALDLFSWSRSKGSDVWINNIIGDSAQTVIEFTYADQIYKTRIPFVDEASIHNAISCLCVLLNLKIPLAEIIDRLPALRSVEMRLELKQGVNNTSIINDSYSSDINSLLIALNFLSQQQQHKTKTVILSDMLQTGKAEPELYNFIARVLTQKKIQKFVGIGPAIEKHKQCFPDSIEKHFFSTTAEFLRKLPELNFQSETILLKGARVFGFEKISHAFEEKKHETILEINLQAIRHNLNHYRSFLKPGVRLMAMVKAFSYGTGSFEIANVMQHAGVDYLAVAYADEGVALRQEGIRLPVMVMNTEQAGFDNLLKYNLEPELYSFNILKSFLQFLPAEKQLPYPVHIKLDTGMHRLGFQLHDIEELCTILREAKGVRVQSVFSHLAASGDEDHDAFTKEQASNFNMMAARIQGALGYSFLKHIANTSAIHRHPDLQMDMVRLGIGLYGVDANERIQAQLHNVAQLRTTVSQIKSLKKGESVGYNRQGIAEGNTTIATVRIGYADGYPRSLSNGAGKMLIKGQLVPVIGNVCMDMTMLDVSGLNISEGDEVIVFGKDLPVAQLSTWAKTIPYEILTGISQRVKRIYFEE